jgi:hypothetical protein
MELKGFKLWFGSHLAVCTVGGGCRGFGGRSSGGCGGRGGDVVLGLGGWVKPPLFNLGRHQC